MATQKGSKNWEKKGGKSRKGVNTGKKNTWINPGPKEIESTKTGNYARESEGGAVLGEKKRGGAGKEWYGGKAANGLGVLPGHSHGVRRRQKGEGYYGDVKRRRTLVGWGEVLKRNLKALEAY